MKRKLFGFLKTNRQGIALISVLGMVTLATILILALFSVSDAEFKASRVYADGNQARQLADMAVNLVTSQIQSAATGQGADTSPTIWASQPGAVRIYDATGRFVYGRKLYSSNQMVVSNTGTAGETLMAEDFPSANWNRQPSEWVDLNPIVTRVNSSAAGAATATYYPIMDPAASATVGDALPVEGFSYSKQNFSGKTLPGVIPAGGGETAALPMPVQWLYVLKDGSLGTVTQAPDAATASWVAAGGKEPSEENPIIGRVGFWTDDESCKININTAGEPSYYGVPTIYHSRDNNWANNPPATFEYQRFPGHPATIALSSVLYPNAAHATGRYDGDSYPNYPDSYLQLKNAIYELTPKLGMGGSQDGTLAFDVDDFSSKVTANYVTLSTNRLNSAREHLYTSVDEWIYDKISLNEGKRQKVNINYGGGGTLIDQDKILRSRPFLTANSRASELNMFGMPRVAIWPVSDESLGAKFRTGYDDTIAGTSGLGRPPVGSGAYNPNSYIFRRRDSQSALVDIGSSGLPSTGLQRNGELMNYLDRLLNATMPGGGSFRTKYGVADTRQILVEIFDYIRCTNLYDAYLDELYIKEKNGQRDFMDDNSPAVAGAIALTGTDVQKQIALWNRVPAQFSYYTYTAPRFDTVRREQDLAERAPDKFRKDFNKGNPTERVTVASYPGHGQVRPIEWAKEGVIYKGFGRFPTISEVALQFICTGDGFTGTDDNPDPGAYLIVKNSQKIRSGGKTAQRFDSATPWDLENKRQPLITTRGNIRVKNYWYSNIPPYPGRKLFEKWGVDFSITDARNPAHYSKHPGWDPLNWNCTLESDPVNGGIALEEDEKRVQAAIQLEMFVPSVGYTKYTPDFTVVLNGTQLSGLQVQDGTGRWRSLFSTTGDLVVQSTSAYWGSLLGEASVNNNVSPMGGSYGSTPLMSGRQAKAIGRMPKDPGYSDAATSDVHSGMLNFPLISNPFTVKRWGPGGIGDRTARIKFRVPNQAIQADIYASHDWQGRIDKKNATPVQSVMIQIPGAAGAGEETGVHSTPVPRLVVYTSDRRIIESNGTKTDIEMIHACRWWAFNNSGALRRYKGEPKFPGSGPLGIDYNPVEPTTTFGDRDNRAGTWGRFHNQDHTEVTTYEDANGYSGKVPVNSRIYGYSSFGQFTGVKSKPEDLANEDTVRTDKEGNHVYGYWGSDSVRSIIPRHGDYRILAARRNVPADVWQLHPVWQVNPNALFAHSLTGFRSDSEVGYDTGPKKDSTVTPPPIDPTLRLVSGAWYPTSHVPDTPLTTQASAISSTRRDFDNGSGNIRDGAYINKADDGNLSVAQFWYASSLQYYQTRNAYFQDSFLQMPAKNAFFTPNRMLTGPGMFGSLPTGVFGSVPQGDANPAADGIPWRTLLFRPDVSTPSHVGALPPADHNILDLFWMPVVEPYAISDSFSTAGKINMNFQMVPFTHINRSTGMSAALKGELITAVSSSDTVNLSQQPSVNNTLAYKRYKDASTSPKTPWTEADNKLWHRQIDINETVQLMKNRLNSAGGDPAKDGLFRTASQICEVHLIPNVTKGQELSMKGMRGSAVKNTMSTFWNNNSLTGDNMRERPYTNLYQKLTTKSNTFRVHFVAQTLKKARSIAADQIDESRDNVTAEYRGSALLERFLDFTNKDYSQYPNYGSMADPFSVPSLESEYRYRVLEMKQFLP